MANMYDTQQVLNKVLNLLKDALRVELDETAIGKLDEIISLMGGSALEKELIDHDLLAAPFALLIEPESKWTPKMLALNFSSVESRIVNVYLRDEDSSEDLLIRSFTKDDDIDEKTVLNLWFTDFGIAPFLEGNMALYITVSQTAGACDLTGLIAWDEVGA